MGLLLCGGPAEAALRLRLDRDGLSPAEAATAHRLLDEAQARLPPAFAALPDTEVAVRWSEALPEAVHGRTRGGELLLNRRLLSPLAGEVVAAAGDGADESRRAALAAVLHELAHVYDRVAPGGAPSRDPRLLDLAGWQLRATRLGTALFGRRENRMLDRSPDAYELADPAEFFAVNFELFLLDPQYACRRPALYRHFAARLGAPPLVPADCAEGFVYVDAGIESGGETPLAEIDPERVYQVDYLLAEANERPMSRWGHSMLRLVVCVPGRPRGPDCRLDLEHHRVLSFRAFVDDVQISNWRGLTGRYPSRLFVLPLGQVVDEYTRVELRGLASLPLRLERDEIAALVERAAQLHWSYDGRYYFLSNNCAVETWRLLRDGAPRLADAGLESITPTGLLDRLRRADAVDVSVLDDPAEALRLGYRFDSLRERFQAMFDVARDRLGLPQAHVEDWLALPPGMRRPWLEQADLRASAALLLLEQAALRRQRLAAQDELKRRYLGGRGRLRESAEAEAMLRRFLSESGFLGRPAQVLAGLPDAGYGLPQAREREALARESERRRQRLQRLSAELDEAARRLLPPQRRATLDGIQANADLLGGRLREMHEAAGGIRLP